MWVEDGFRFDICCFVFTSLVFAMSLCAGIPLDELAQFRNKSWEYLEQVSIHRRKQELLDSYGKDAKGVIDSIVMSKTKDEKTGRLFGGRGFDHEQQQKKDLLKAPWVPEILTRIAIKSAINSANREIEEVKLAKRTREANPTRAAAAKST